MVNFGLLAAEIGWRVSAPHQISTAFSSWLRYCTDVARRKSTKLCTMFGRLLGSTLYIQLYSPLLVEKRKNLKKENQANNKSNDKNQLNYTFSGALAP